MGKFTFRQFEDALAELYEVSDQDRSKLRARLKQLQRLEFPAAAKVGQGPRAQYWLEEIFQVALVFELVELSMTTARAVELVRHFWPTLVSTITTAWIEFEGEGLRDPELILVDAQDYDGFLKRDSLGEWKLSRIRHQYSAANARDPRILQVGRASEFFRPGLSSVGAGFEDLHTRRAAIIDATKLVRAVRHHLIAKGHLTAREFDYWCVDVRSLQSIGPED